LDAIEDAVDKQIVKGLEYVQAGKFCDFEVGRGSTKKDYRQRMGVRTETLQAILNGLIAKGTPATTLPYVKTTKVLVLANSIDHDLAVGFYSYLRQNNMTVKFSSAEEFESKKYAEKIIILGGHGAPEGVGGIVSSLTTLDTREDLEKPNATMYLVKEGVWTLNQKIVLIAGYSREDTQKAWMEHKEEVVELF
jgi:hypothetical protein